MVNTMVNTTQILIDFNTNLKIREYKLFIESTLRKNITMGSVIAEFIAFIDNHPDLFRTYIESLKSEEVTERGAAEK